MHERSQMTPALTPAQRRALMALTGEWERLDPLTSFDDFDEIGIRDLGLAELRYSFPVLSDMEVYGRLTPAGLELKEKLK